MAKSRIAYLDKIKGISILLVVFCHSVMLSAGGVLGNIVMCVAWGAVPCFFMVTGALLNNAQKFDWKKYFARFFKAYAVLAVWKIIYLLVTCTYAKVDISLSKLFEYVFLFGNLDGVKTGDMWFMTAYLLVLLLRGAFCAMIVYGISIVCMRKGITAPVNLNILSIGTGALLGLPGIIVLYAAAVFLLQ